jgi:glycoprotein endo-alpha-1,2-mannosidase
MAATRASRCLMHPFRIGRFGRAAAALTIIALFSAYAHAQAVTPQILAYYYGWYGNPAVSGSWRHWKGVDPARQVIDNMLRFPALGAYDSHDPKIVESHVAAARAAGITGFIASWWGPGSFEDKGIPQLLAAARNHQLAVSVSVARITDTQSTSRTRGAIAEIEHLLRNYAGDPAWLRVGGKPVLFIYGRAVHQLSTADWREVIDQVQRDISGGVFLVADSPGPDYRPLFEAFNHYNITGETQHKTPPQIRDWARRTYRQRVAAAGRGRISNVTVIPGYDDRKSNRPSPRPVTERWGGETYRVLWEEAIAALPDWILITSWNEWHEDSEIEPSADFGLLYLQQTSGFARRFLTGQRRTR